MQLFSEQLVEIEQQSRAHLVEFAKLEANTEPKAAKSALSVNSTV
jgi:hypothetical protein